MLIIVLFWIIFNLSEQTGQANVSERGQAGNETEIIPLSPNAGARAPAKNSNVPYP